MMDGHYVVSTGVVVLVALISLAKLWLRLRFRLRNERERRYLRVMLALPAGSRVQEQREDGTQLTVAVGDAPRKEPR